MIIGIDFDNTIINYDNLFYLVAKKQGWSKVGSKSKVEIKKQLIKEDGNDLRWQFIQKEVYSKFIEKAEPFDAVIAFIKNAQKQGDSIYIISHKTKFSKLDGSSDLIDPAYKWLETKGFIGEKGRLKREQVFFCESRAKKLKTIQSLCCDLFIDDLSAVLLDKKFPIKTIPLLFSTLSNKKLININHWQQLDHFFNLVNGYDFCWLISLSQLYMSLIKKVSLSPRGGNNQLYFIYFQNGEKCVVKQAEANKVEALKNEFNALNTLNKYHIKGVAKALSFSPQHAELVQSYLAGKPITTISNEHIDSVINFILSLAPLEQKKINYRNRGVYRNRLDDYSQAINRRWESITNDLVGLSKTYPIFYKINRLMKELSIIKEKVLDEFERQVKSSKLGFNYNFPDNELIFNPSDFGFHNILENAQGSLSFLDFEYFVYDDRAKMVCDFIHHAGHNLTIKQQCYFLEQLNKNNFFTPPLKLRVIILINMVGFEWLLIILNIAQTDKLKQKLHANPELTVEQLVETQYNKAKKIINFYQKNIENDKELFTLGINKRDLYFE